MSDVTELLLQWNEGDAEARARLTDQLYGGLQRIARAHLSRESAPHELAPAELVHEAYCRLVQMDRVAWRDRTHFLSLASTLMRQILIDEARKRRAVKRDGGVQVTLTGIVLGVDHPSTDILMLHEALQRLAEADPQRARLVELRYFGGLTIEETALELELSPATVKRNWEVARGWLLHAMQDTR